MIKLKLSSHHTFVSYSSNAWVNTNVNSNIRITYMSFTYILNKRKIIVVSATFFWPVTSTPFSLRWQVPSFLLNLQWIMMLRYGSLARPGRRVTFSPCPTDIHMVIKNMCKMEGNCSNVSWKRFCVIMLEVALYNCSRTDFGHRNLITVLIRLLSLRPRSNTPEVSTERGLFVRIT